MSPVWRAWLGALAALAALLSGNAPARAHGREPMVGAIAFDPGDPDHVVVRATWAILESRDGGASFTWRCAAAVGYDRTTEDPPVAVAEGGEIFAGTFDGIAHGGPDGCAWALVGDEDGVGQYAIDLERAPGDPRTLYAMMSPGAVDNTLLRSTDAGATWEVMGLPRPGTPVFLAERIALAPSDPMRVYVSGAVPATATDPLRHAFFLRSEDGGRTFVEHELPLEGEERNAHVLGVDPLDPDRVFLRMSRRVTDTVPERLLVSDDGGDTWALAATLLEITGFAMSEDGAHAWVGGWDGAFLRSDARGAAGTFAPVSTAPDLRVRCLAWRPGDSGRSGELWVCVDDLVGSFALGRSSDLGQTLTPVWGFEDATEDTGCGRCTPVGVLCPEYWGDVVFDLGLRVDAGGLDASAPLSRDAGLPRECIDGDVPDLDGGVGMDTGGGGPIPPAAGCACGAAAPAARGARLPGAAAVGMLLWVVGLRRRGATSARSRGERS